MKLLILAALFIAVPAWAADAPQLTLEQKTMLRCSAAFAIIANEQSRGIASAKAYPPLAERGKEYFVRAAAKLMADHQLNHERIDALYRTEIKRLQDESVTAKDPQKYVSSLMQPCLLSLDASGL